MKLKIIFFLLLLAATQSQAQTGRPDPSAETVRYGRLTAIDRYHASLGIGVGYGNILTIAPQASIGAGSLRDLTGADLGIRFESASTLHNFKKERITLIGLGLFLSSNINVIRWNHHTTYLGAEVCYHANLRASHHIDETPTTHDDNAAQNHFSISVRLGLRQYKWDISLFYQYSLAPAFDQKYIYESRDYNYTLLHDDIFARSLFGARLVYHLKLNT